MLIKQLNGVFVSVYVVSVKESSLNVLDTTSLPGPPPWLLGKSQGRSQGRGHKNELVLEAEIKRQ